MPANAPLFHDLLLSPISHHSVWSVITAHNLTPDNRGVISIDTLHWSQLVRGYNTADTLTRHNRHMGHSSEMSKNTETKCKKVKCLVLAYKCSIMNVVPFVQ